MNRDYSRRCALIVIAVRLELPYAWVNQMSKLNLNKSYRYSRWFTTIAPRLQGTITEIFHQLCHCPVYFRHLRMNRLVWVLRQWKTLNWGKPLSHEVCQTLVPDKPSLTASSSLTHVCSITLPCHSLYILYMLVASSIYRYLGLCKCRHRHCTYSSAKIII